MKPEAAISAHEQREIRMGRIIIKMEKNDELKLTQAEMAAVFGGKLGDEICDPNGGKGILQPVCQPASGAFCRYCGGRMQTTDNGKYMCVWAPCRYCGKEMDKDEVTWK